MVEITPVITGWGEGGYCKVCPPTSMMIITIFDDGHDVDNDHHVHDGHNIDHDHAESKIRQKYAIL